MIVLEKSRSLFVLSRRYCAHMADSNLVDKAMLSARVTPSPETKMSKDSRADTILECLMGFGPMDSSLNHSSKIGIL